MTRRWWFAPALDLVCIVSFIFVGAGRHNINEGADWFLLVLWPIAVGWYGVALLARLYTSSDRMWLRLTITLAAGTVVMSILRGAFTDRPTVSIFTVVFVAWMVLTAYGWRLVAKWFGARRARSAPATS
jgi:hypothetical protein